MKKRAVLAKVLCFVMMLSGSYVYAAAEDASLEQPEVFEAAYSGAVFTLPEAYQEAKGTIDFVDAGDSETAGEGIVQFTADYFPMPRDTFNALLEEEAAAEQSGDLDKALELLMQLHYRSLFRVYGLNEGRGVDALKDYLVSQLTSGDTAAELTEEEIAQEKEQILSRQYVEIGERDGITYILTASDPDVVKDVGPFPGDEEGYEEYDEEYLSLLAMTPDLGPYFELTGGVEFHEPVRYAEEGTAISFEATDLDGNPVSSEELFAGHELTMINLWGTWCGPCKRELPDLEALHEELQEKNCQIIGIVTDAFSEEKIEEAKKILKDSGVTYVNLTAFEEMAQLFPQDAYPTSYFVDESGELVGEPVVGAYFDQYRERFAPYLS